MVAWSREHSYGPRYSRNLAEISHNFLAIFFVDHIAVRRKRKKPGFFTKKPGFKVNDYRCVLFELTSQK